MNPNRLTMLFSIFLLLATALAGYGYTQAVEQDSLKRQLAGQPNDTTRLRLLNQLVLLYALNRPDTAYRLAHQAYQLSGQLADKSGQAVSLSRMGAMLNNLGDQPKALRLLRQALEISRAIDDPGITARILNNTALVYSLQKDHRRALPLYLASLAAIRQASRQSGSFDAAEYITAFSNLGETYWYLNRLDSADYYSQQGLQLARGHEDERGLYSVLDVLGHIQETRGNSRAALNYYRQSLAIARQIGELSGQADVYLSIAGLYQKTGPADSARSNAQHALTTSQQSQYLSGILKASQLLTQLYEGRDNTQALAYYKVMVAAKDSLFSQEKVKQLLTIDFEEQQRQQELAATREAYQNRLRTYGLLGLVALVLVIVGLLWRTNRRQKTTNQLLSKQKDEIEQQRGKVQQAFTELQAAQTQLIHQEKMASLGELTAGIAHEIQNPLNFVNNFARISIELVDELKTGPVLSLPDTEQVYAHEILADLSQNLTKINQHGRRADAIVKGMLAHSQPATGTKQLTDLNALANEYLQLAYHGVQAKDKNINVRLETDFDTRIERVNLVAQDMGRVLLNLYNNAFYAVQEKKNNVPASDEYQPTVWVRTRQEANHIVIDVRDNGTGMPESVQSKVFQPFFTTKPSGKGTGLGLSLSYDTVTKGHGGMLTVVSEPGQFTQMQIILPLSTIPQSA